LQIGLGFVMSIILKKEIYILTKFHQLLLILLIPVAFYGQVKENVDSSLVSKSINCIHSIDSLQSCIYVSSYYLTIENVSNLPVYQPYFDSILITAKHSLNFISTHLNKDEIAKNLNLNYDIKKLKVLLLKKKSMDDYLYDFIASLQNIQISIEEDNSIKKKAKILRCLYSDIAKTDSLLIAISKFNLKIGAGLGCFSCNSNNVFTRKDLMVFTFKKDEKEFNVIISNFQNKLYLKQFIDLTRMEIIPIKKSCF